MPRMRGTVQSRPHSTRARSGLPNTAQPSRRSTAPELNPTPKKSARGHGGTTPRRHRATSRLLRARRLLPGAGLSAPTPSRPLRGGVRCGSVEFFGFPTTRGRGGKTSSSRRMLSCRAPTRSRRALLRRGGSPTHAAASERAPTQRYNSTSRHSFTVCLETTPSSTNGSRATNASAAVRSLNTASEPSRGSKYGPTASSSPRA